MKKRLLITSIVMMLVVAVALSTATYAWFTSNATVKASNVQLTAAVNDNAAIGIAWLGSSASKNALVAANGTGLMPMVPGNYTVGVTKDSEMGYASSTVYTDNNGSTYKFNAAGSTETPYIWNDGGDPDGDPAPIPAVQTFYIRNLSETTAVDVTIKVLIFDKMTQLDDSDVLAAGTQYYKLVDGIYTLMVAGAEGDYTADTSTPTALGYNVYTPNTTSDVTSLVRVAVFTCDTEDGNYVLSNVFTEVGGDADHKNVSAGAIVANDPTTSVQNTKTSIAQNVATSLKTNLAGATNVYVRVHVWLDGDGFVDVLGGGQANVALVFDAAKHA